MLHKFWSEVKNVEARIRFLAFNDARLLNVFDASTFISYTDQGLVLNII